MKKEDIINAYVRIRQIDHTIPDDVLDFMKDSAIEKLQDDYKYVEDEEPPVETHFVVKSPCGYR